MANTLESPPRPLNILIDAANRDAETGTGVSTYAFELARALNALGCRTSWLGGSPSPGDAGPLSRASAFGASRIGGLAGRWRATLSASPAPVYATRHSSTANIANTNPHESDRLENDSSHLPQDTGTRAPDDWNSPNLYRLAHHRHVWTSRFTQVETPPGIDVLHLTTPQPVAMKNVRSVLTIHDLIPLLLPGTTPENPEEFRRRLRTGAARADLVLAVSEAAKADIVRHLDVAPGKVAVTWQSTDITPLNSHEKDALSRVLFRFGLKPQDYLLFVGAIEPKKNLRRLIDAFLSIDTHMPLAIVGKRAWLWEKEIGDLSRRYSEQQLQRVKFLGYAPRSDLRFLYSGAAAFVFPSLYEGFGLPPLEAMTCGAPVLTSHVSSLPEVCGDAAVYVDPHDAADIRRGLEQLIADAHLRERLSWSGLARAAQFAFPRYVEKLGEAYARLGAGA